MGCDEGEGRKEIYIPWWGFEGNTDGIVVEKGKAYEIAEQYHPYWNNLKDGAKKLQARNSHQVLGLDLETPTDAIICWTPKGKGSGGTGQALRIGKALNIPIFDAGRFKDVETTRKFLWNFLINTGLIGDEYRK